MRETSVEKAGSPPIYLATQMKFQTWQPRLWKDIYTFCAGRRASRIAAIVMSFCCEVFFFVALFGHASHTSTTTMIMIVCVCVWHQPHLSISSRSA